jgi:hypothetical protein
MSLICNTSLILVLLQCGREFVEERCKEQKKHKTPTHRQALMIFQCDAGNKYQNLVACTSYNIINEFNQVLDQLTSLNITINVLLIIHLPRKSGGCFVGFQGGRWLSYHIDDLMPPSRQQFSFEHLRQMTTVSKLFESAPNNGSGLQLQEQMDVQENGRSMMDTSMLAQFEVVEVAACQSSSVEMIERGVCNVTAGKCYRFNN